ncbi:ubiquitin-conjugating enzyme E2 Z isoform X2 [Procambarus clarkii]|uniref:ubiquitin-conjugating enzyme E2 Z isoform X2 n=1 Tax=Procambarus clarkii TaxID=6728 RepID=UPI001E6776FF|nr:ubiquitin-conjugating enzyme E2 Z-like isoform X2 [Procambarus clarkii]
MESQSTVVEADSTSIIPTLESLSNAVHSSVSLPDGVNSSQSLSASSSPTQSPLTVITSSGSLTVWPPSQYIPTDCPHSQSPISEYLLSNSPPVESLPISPSQSSVWSSIQTVSTALPSSQSTANISILNSSTGPHSMPVLSSTALPSSQPSSVLPLLPSAVISPSLSSTELTSSQSLLTELQTSQTQSTSVSSFDSAQQLSPFQLSLSAISTVLSPLSPPLVLSNPQSPHAVPVDQESFYLPSTSSGSWRYDPLASPDWDRAGPPGNLCAGRVKKDLSSIFTEPLPGIFAAPEEDNLFKVHCLIIGPFDTPYEGGFFHFLVRFGPQYPLHPPRVRLLTTGGDSVRFNPNLYKNGKVCLSILGTWSGPAWSPASNLSSVLLSLQSLMNERPYHNEPGYEEEHNIGDSERYNSIIMHETIRVAVIQQLEGITTAPPDLLKVMQASFMEYFDHYVEICEKNKHRDGQTMDDPFGERRGRFQYGILLKHLKKLKIKLKASGIPEVPEAPISTENDDVSSISESDEGSPASEADFVFE